MLLFSIKFLKLYLHFYYFIQSKNRLKNQLNVNKKSTKKEYIMTRYKFEIEAVKPVEQSVNHVFVVDVSGSMYDALPKMRQHIKSKLALLVKPKDTVSIIYFSSKSQYGVVFEGEKINGLSDLSNLHKAVDKFLQTLGLTGFVEPIQEAMDVAKRLNHNGNINSFIFMTDGYDNQWGKAEIINKAKLLPKFFASISFIEYGWYCNRPLIAEMAQVSGGAHIFSEDYKTYEPTVEKLFQNKTVKRKPVKVGSEYAFYVDNGEVVLVDADEGVVQIPEDVNALYTMSNDKEYKAQISSMDDVSKYVALYVAIHKMNADMAWLLLKSLGDVRLIKMYANCFSKQEYSTVKDAVKSCIVDEKQRFADGVDYNLVPKEDAYTVLDLLNDLMSGENFLQTNHEAFSYSRIGAKTVQKDLSQEKLEELKAKMAETKDVEEIKRLAQEMADLNTWNPIFTEKTSEKGEPILNLVFNETRPNISIQIKKEGFIELPDDKVSQFSLPKQLPTHIFRNYTIVKDGILNMKVLPVTLDEGTFNQLKKENVLEGVFQANHVYLVDLTKVPLINRQMVKEVSALEFFTRHLQLQALKAKQKVFKAYMDEVAPKKQAKLLELYGADAVAWLETIGVKDYGFSPKVTAEKSGDFYYSKELDVKLAGLSSLPSMKAVNDKLTKKSKLNLADTLMVDAINEYKAFVESPMVQKSAAKETLIETWLTTETKSAIQEVRKTQYDLNKILYSIVVGQAWFKEFSSLDDNEMVVKFHDQDVKCQAILGEKEIAI